MPLALDAELAAAERAALLSDALRVAHTLKGAARSAGVLRVEELCHALEDVLVRARDGEPVAGLVQLLLDAGDALRASAAALRASGQVEAGALGRILDALRGGDAPRAAGPAPGGEPAAEVGLAATLRVGAAHVDRLLALAGELLVVRTGLDARWAELDDVRASLAGLGEGLTGAARERVRSAQRDLERLTTAVRADSASLRAVAAALEDGVEGLRMLPFAEVVPDLTRAARDAARACGKEVELVVRGERAQVDRVVLHALQGPLRHLVRNAVDHGVEPPAGRAALGKPAVGEVLVEVAVRGDRVDVTVADDGAGVDLAAVRARARALGLEPGREGGADEAPLLELLFRPGFSTSAAVTEVSGRGVGLDVVAREVAAIHGRVSLQQERGRGTRVTTSVPLTLATLRVLLVQAAGQTYAVQEGLVERVVRIAPEDLRPAGGGVVAAVGGEVLDARSLAAALGAEPPPARTRERRPALLLAVGGRRALVVVEAVEGEREVVVKGLGPRVRRLRHVAGVTLLADGRLVPILDAAGLAEVLQAPADAAAARVAPARPRVRIVLAEDSLTTRTLEESILVAAGYEVVSAPDGEEAWRLLQVRGADALVADVQMPRLDGLELTRRVRSSRRLRDLPVILVTALASDEDRLRGLEAGASAYVVKSAFDQRVLLEALERLTGGPGS